MAYQSTTDYTTTDYYTITTNAGGEWISTESLPASGISYVMPKTPGWVWYDEADNKLKSLPAVEEKKNHLTELEELFEI